MLAKSKPVSLISRRLSANSISHVGFGCVIQPGEMWIGLEF